LSRDILIRSATFTKYSEVARGLGIDPIYMVNQVGLTRQCLVTPELRVPESLLTDVLESSAKASQCASLGLMIGETWRLPDFGIISLLLQHQPTLRQALLVIKSYRHLLSDSVMIDITEFPNVVILQMVLVSGRTHPGRQRTELAIGALLSLCQFQLGTQWKPRCVHFMHSAPARLQSHHRVFGNLIEFQSEFDGIVVSKEDLDYVNPSSDFRMARYAQDFIELQPRSRQPSIEEDVRRTILALLPSGRSNIDHVSQNLGVGPRTLQRKLEQKGGSFHELLNDVRREKAIRYLESKDYSINQITKLLGFSEISTFSRWFSQQFKVSPSRWN
jgi:AraC-like DNA-binding protein